MEQFIGGLPHFFYTLWHSDRARHGWIFGSLLWRIIALGKSSVVDGEGMSLWLVAIDAGGVAKSRPLIERRTQRAHGRLKVVAPYDCIAPHCH